LEFFIADLILQILSRVAQEEPERIWKRQRGGIDAAFRYGVSFGFLVRNTNHKETSGILTGLFLQE
jgi:DNA invertase Pin-like site-specific DNA recombinase